MKKVAIVGGGMGGLATAFELVAKHPGEYEIHVYERDWRLGGKGASGRNLDPALGMRIEEHGLHILMGFYENVFEILHRCYGDLRAAGDLPKPPANAVWWNGVLHAIDEIFFSEPPHGQQKEWTHWHVPFPANSRLIGGPAQPLPSVREMFVEVLKEFWDRAKQRFDIFTAALLNLSPLELLSSVDQLDLFTGTETERSLLRTTIEKILEVAFSAIDKDSDAQHQWFVALYFAGCNLLGMLHDVLPNEAGYIDAMDVLDYKEWIEQYNVLELPTIYLKESAPVNAVYDLVFSRGTGFAAGTALYDTMVMLFHYRGHIFYKMAGGMGDVVFAPLYKWLDKHGVKFHFFHDLVDVALSADQQRVEKLIFDITKVPAAGVYDPIVWVDCKSDSGQPVKLPCWPSTPKPGLQAGPGKTEVTDFDSVVLAIPVGAIREQNAAGKARCAALYADPKFAAMAKGLVTRGTRAVQLWFTCDLAGLGWTPLPSKPQLGPVLGSYLPDLKNNAWADMSQVLARETWAGAVTPTNIAYLCDVFDDNLVDDAARARVHDDGIKWLAEAAGGLWPNTAAPFPWDKLHDPANGVDVARFESQYWRANTDGSSQYVTGAPKTTSLRLDPHETAFTNLFLAGDWVKTPVNAGCVEGAAMGGRLAGRRIAEYYKLHPVAPPSPGGVSALAGFAAGSSPAYVDRDGDLPLLQPVVMNDVTMHGYLLHADHGALATMLDQTFGKLGITCKPLLPLVIATSVRAEEIRSKVRPGDGYMTEAELGFWVPVSMQWATGSSKGFYLPYLFVDNPAAMLAGREIYGFNKILGQFSYATPGDIDPTSVKAQVLHTHDPVTQLDWRTVVSVKTPNPDKESFWQTIEELFEDVIKSIIDALPGVDLNTAFHLPSAPVFFLKQFRAAADGSKACMQSAIKAHVSLESDTVSGGWIPDAGIEISFTSHATIDIAKTLGLPATVKPWLAFWAKCSATLEAGQAFGGPPGVEG